MLSVPWDLRRRGLQDSRRHDQRVREAIKKNLRHLITQEAIITSNRGHMIKLPIRYLDQYRFRYANDPSDPSGVGHGAGEVGDVIAKGPHDALPSDLPGDRPGEAIYEVEFSVEELARMMLQDLDLPWLEEKPEQQDFVVREQMRHVAKTGLWPNIDKRRTLYQNLKRHAAKGEPRLGPLINEDLRFRTWDDVKTRQSQACVYMLMDRSGSMTTEKRYIAKCFFFWLVRFLKLKYKNVHMVFIAHDTHAEITDEESFFSISNSGGTRCSSALELALLHLREHHPPTRWNNYVFHFSDGDNLPGDNLRCVELVERLLTQARMVGFGEITYRDWSSFYYSQSPAETQTRGTLFQSLEAIEHPRLLVVAIRRREEVYNALQAFLAGDGAAA